MQTISETQCLQWIDAVNVQSQAYSTINPEPELLAQELVVIKSVAQDTIDFIVRILELEEEERLEREAEEAAAAAEALGDNDEYSTSQESGQLIAHRRASMQSSVHSAYSDRTARSRVFIVDNERVIDDQDTGGFDGDGNSIGPIDGQIDGVAGDDDNSSVAGEMDDDASYRVLDPTAELDWENLQGEGDPVRDDEAVPTRTAEEIAAEAQKAQEAQALLDREYEALLYAQLLIEHIDVNRDESISLSELSDFLWPNKADSSREIGAIIELTKMVRILTVTRTYIYIYTHIYTYIYIY
jgi:hypothetical protein